MSDIAMKDARLGGARTASDSPPRGRWRRLKVRIAGFADAIGETLHAMDVGRRQHPVISARR